MRLADQIMAHAGGPLDTFGAYEALAKPLLEAQRFECSAELVEAAYRVASTRPSSMAAALPMIRYPYRSCWFEWLGADDPRITAPTSESPRPERMGVLVECLEDQTTQVGMATWAWLPPGAESPVVNPIGVVFDFSESQSLITIARQMATAVGHPLPDVGIDETQQAMGQISALKHYMDDPKEVAAVVTLTDRQRACPTPHTMKMCEAISNAIKESRPELMRRIIEESYGNIEGEPLFLAALVLLLNSRNVARRGSQEDLSRLNKSRLGRRKTALLPFIKTTILLSRVQGRRAGSGASAAERRRHLVMGHFKLRKTGVFWWSPYHRGNPGGGEVRRSHYEVAA